MILKLEQKRQRMPKRDECDSDRPRPTERTARQCPSFGPVKEGDNYEGELTVTKMNDRDKMRQQEDGVEEEETKIPS